MNEGEQRKLNGMAQALDAVPAWRMLAYRTVHRQPPGAVIKSEWLTDRIGKPRGKTGQHRNNAVGGVFSALARRGILQRVGYEKGQLPVSHANLRSVWVRTDKVLTRTISRQ